MKPLHIKWITLFGLLALLPVFRSSAQSSPQEALAAEIDRRAAAIEEQVISWRRDIHQHPELGNREFRTARLVAEHLRGLGIEVRAEVAHTGVIGLLRGKTATPVIAIRADMDALPVTEQVDVPFASKVTATYNGQEVGVMHACGHDNHVAILMGVAQVLASMREQIPGTVKFIFQPAEEGPPAGEEGGADLMIREGTLEDPVPDAIFGLHVLPAPVGAVVYRSGPFLASSDGFSITVRGRQTHGAIPWGGVDPIVVASQIVLGLQTIASRQVDTTLSPSIVSVGSIHGGVRGNIIPDEVKLVGTIRTFDAGIREEIHRRVRNTATKIAESAQASAEVSIRIGYPVTVNDPELTAEMIAILQRVHGEERVVEVPRITGAEDFSLFAEKVPGFYFGLGVTPPEVDPDTAPRNHSPLFAADERALKVGLRSLTHMAVGYLEAH